MLQRTYLTPPFWASRRPCLKLGAATIIFYQIGAHYRGSFFIFPMSPRVEKTRLQIALQTAAPHDKRFFLRARMEFLSELELHPHPPAAAILKRYCEQGNYLRCWRAQISASYRKKIFRAFRRRCTRRPAWLSDFSF